MNGDPRVVGVRRFLVGQAGPFPRVVFREEVFAQMDQLAQEHPSGESGGFLVGRKRNLKSLEEYEIVVDQFVPLLLGASWFALTKTTTACSALQSSGSNLRIVAGCTAIRIWRFPLCLINSTSGCLTARGRSLTLSMPSWGTALYHCVDHAWRIAYYYICGVNTAIG